MPIYQSFQFEIDFSRNVLLIDTGVVYAAFSEDDQRKESAQAFLELWDGDILITASVVVEAWGMLVGRDGHWDRGVEFLSWLQNPGHRVFLLPQEVNEFARVFEIVSGIHISCVDSLMARSAHCITEHCSMNPYLQVATYDIGDYLKARSHFNLRFNVIDPDTLDVYP